MRVRSTDPAEFLPNEDLTFGQARDLGFDDFKRPVRRRKESLPRLHETACGMAQKASACRMPSINVVVAKRGSTDTSSTISA